MEIKYRETTIPSGARELTDEIYQKALAVCIKNDCFSAAGIQRSCFVGYHLAIAIQDRFIEDGYYIAESDKSPNSLRGKDDPAFQEVLDGCTKANDFTVLFMQRTFKISYARAAAIKRAFGEIEI